jgi:hypothetical protein
MSLRRAFVCTLRVLFLLTVPIWGLVAQDPQTQPATGPKPQAPAQSQPATQPGAGPAKPEEAKPEDIEQQQPAFYVHAEPDRASRAYYEGEQMTIRVKSEADAYLYVIYEQADGATYVVFPNSAQPDNRVKAKQEVEIPGKDDTFRWTIGAPFGNELMKVIASKERIAELEKPDVRQKRFTPVTGKGIRNVIKQLGGGAPAQGWSEVTLKITTHAGVNPNSPYYGKRYAAIFAVPVQWVTQPTKDVFGKAPASNLGLGPVYDASMMERCLRSRGGIEVLASAIGIIELKSPPATKQLIKNVITEVLPSQTQPGDTVMIYFSGHGANIPDSREKDGFSEFLVPSDFLEPRGLVALRRLQAQGESLSDQLKELLARGETWLREAQVVFDPDGPDWEKMSQEAQDESFQRAAEVLIKRSAITDDEFGHWVQALDGRRVVVVLDACMSGGFAEEEGDQPKDGSADKSLAKVLDRAAARRRGQFRFDFLRGQLGRLKDLGQGNTAMLAAACPAESSVQLPVFPEQEPAAAWRLELIKEIANRDQPAEGDRMGVFTFYLANTLLKSPGPVNVQQAGEACQKGLKEYFRWLAERTDIPKLAPHTPVYFDHSRPAILLKP